MAVRCERLRGEDRHARCARGSGRLTRVPPPSRNFRRGVWGTSRCKASSEAGPAANNPRPRRGVLPTERPTRRGDALTATGSTVGRFRPGLSSSARRRFPSEGKGKESAMVSVIERRKLARSKDPAGSVSRHAQQRVDERVRDVMARRDAANQRRDSHADQPVPARRLASSRPVTRDA